MYTFPPRPSLMDSSAAARASSSWKVFPAHNYSSGVRAQEVYMGLHLPSQEQWQLVGSKWVQDEDWLQAIMRDSCLCRAG